MLGKRVEAKRAQEALLEAIKETKESKEFDADANIVAPYMNQEDVQPMARSVVDTAEQKSFKMGVEKHDQKSNERCCQKCQEAHDTKYVEDTGVNRRI